ncbi:MAG: hypothetical protein RMZ41_006540 [Nostoc sp. DedVER02]|uniref:hypothetical protein n=1 Tax=unclassified Nostoc TaxID=2593658 RepID=UPI002AD4C1F6|nr:MULTISPECIES: hypothetical protein [unclassified Nostoc]MDZ7985919.1 hypothetical protein [Nostoc sp. DedVER02]MDZ8111522.1 hypothetical protein [Nostoc sp. DedVER01b]
MSGGIYLIHDNCQLVKMKEEPYESEDKLQKLLADYPSLLAGEQIDSAAPRRWLLISREIAIPDSEDSAGRWALDHLFLDQDGIPTIVEVKQSRNTQIRREVVGQILDYAANAVLFWSIEKIRAQFEANSNAEQLLIDLIGNEEADLEKFWQQVKVNLQLGKVRLVFVADKIPAELQRIVEFLNQQMNPAQVLAVEIKQYVGQGLKTLVPRVIGQTKKTLIPPLEKRQWNALSFMKEVEIKYSPEAAKVASLIIEWATLQALQIQWGTGRSHGSFVPKFNYKGKNRTFFRVWSNATVEICAYEPPFDLGEKKAELLTRFQSVVGTAISINPYCWYIPFSALNDEMVLRQFLEVLVWAIREIKLS